MAVGKKNGGIMDTIKDLQRGAQESSYTVGDVVIFNQNKTHGYVIEVESHQVKVVDESDRVQYVPLTNIDKRIVFDRRKRVLAKDSMGNALQLEDVVNVTAKTSKYCNFNGIIKNIHNNVLFLWDAQFKHRSNFIYAEKARNVTVKGHELTRNSRKTQQGLASQNRIARHPLLMKWVQIIRGEQKGQLGRVTHVIGEVASVEMSVKAKKVDIPVKDLLARNPEEI
jgi:transcription elongation factor